MQKGLWPRVVVRLLESKRQLFPNDDSYLSIDINMQGTKAKLINLQSPINSAIECKGAHEPNAPAENGEQKADHAHVRQVDNQGQDTHQLQTADKEPDWIEK